MRCTLLGTGDITAVPPPFCDLEDAGAARRRRRCGLLVETDDAILLFDAPPEFREGVRHAGVHDLDAAFLTHWHHDHVGGIDDLAMVRDLEFELGLTASARERFEREKPYLVDAFDFQELAHGDPLTVGDVTVTPTPVAHDRPEFDALAFRVATDDASLVYAPDFGTWCPEMPGGDAFREPDLAVLEATSVLSPDRLDDANAALGANEAETPVARANADRTVLVHLNEFLLQRDTDTLEADVAERGYELGADFDTYHV